MLGLGVWEIVLILALVVLIFGAKRIPQIGRGLGEGIRNFKGSLKASDEIEESDETRGSLPPDEDRD